MRARAMTFVTVCQATTAALILLLPACDSAPPAGNRKPQSRPTAPTTQPTTAPATAPNVKPAPPPAEPELPEYLEIIARFDGQAPATVRIEDAAGHRLALDTRNVRRLRIERDQLPLERGRSIALILDGQGIEWRADSEVVEFERSPNGRWIPVDPKDAAPRRPNRIRRP